MIVASDIRSILGRGVRNAIHSGRMPKVGWHALELEPTAGDLLAVLALEAAEEDEE